MLPDQEVQLRYFCLKTVSTDWVVIQVLSQVTKREQKMKCENDCEVENKKERQKKMYGSRERALRLPAAFAMYTQGMSTTKIATFQW